MSRYVFYDADVTGKEEYDICGQDYATLIKTCCKYCSTLSFRITHADTSFVAELEKSSAYPRVERLISGNELKITKSNFRDMLERMIKEDYI